jgi:hypothetical protein
MPVFKLLTVDADAKTVKGESRGYLTAILYLTAANGSGTQLCPLAELAHCDIGCLLTAGRGGMSKDNATFLTGSGVELPDNAVQHARLRRTALFNNNRELFMLTLVTDILRFIVLAVSRDLIPVIRLNGTSDIRWEDIPVCGFANIFAMFPAIQFYDYTKIPNRRRALDIPNYHLTFSYSHVAAFAPIVIKAMQTYGNSVNFAAVFHGPKPGTFLGRSVMNGDETDLRFTDATGVVIALKAKGKARKDTSGFVVRTA